jgi:hypothetical protein
LLVLRFIPARPQTTVEQAPQDLGAPGTDRTRGFRIESRDRQGTGQIRHDIFLAELRDELGAAKVA